jgi:hypothetical protein
MARNYAAGTPTGDNGGPIFGADSPAPFKAVEQYTNENATASSVITLTQDTTAVEVTAVGTPAFVRWVPTTETAAVSPFASVIAIAGATANYDFVVAANTVRRFVVPIESGVNTTFGATITSVQGQNREYGLFQRIAVKTAGVASVMVAEYSKSNSY